MPMPMKSVRREQTMTADEGRVFSDDARPGGVALHHVMRADEGLEETADMIFTILKDAVGTRPGCPRILFLDVEGHRLSRSGAYDHDAFEIMSSFLIGFLSPWLTEICTPLYRARTTNAQRDDLPDRLVTLETSGGLDGARDLANRMDMRIFHSDTGEWVGEEREFADRREGRS